MIQITTMSDINWIGKDGGQELEDVEKYVKSLTEESTRGVIVFTFQKDGAYLTNTFGGVMVSDIAIASLMLQKRASSFLGED